MAIALTPVEIKIITLVMNTAAAPGEVATGAVKLIESLKKRGVSADQFVAALISQGALPKYTKPDYGLISCPFKKYKGELARDIDPSYLRYMIGWVRQHVDPDVQVRYGQWADDMEQFLNQ